MKIIVHPKYQKFSDYISHIPEIFDTQGDTIYKGRNIVKRFRNGNNEWIVKYYKKPNYIQQIVYTFFKKSKAERAYLYAQSLLTKGISTPEGIAYIEERQNGFIKSCYFISTVCTYQAVYPQLVETENYDRYLANKLAAFFVLLHNKGVLHGDPNLNNILFHKNNKGDILFSVIDTNRSIFKPLLTQKECLDNLKRITHRRDLLQYITEQYAKLRKWDTEKSLQEVMSALDKFEKQKRLRRIMKGKR